MIPFAWIVEAKLHLSATSSCKHGADLRAQRIASETEGGEPDDDDTNETEASHEADASDSQNKELIPDGPGRFRQPRRNSCRSPTAVAREKSIEREIVIEAIEEAMQKGARAKYGAEHDIRAVLDPRTGELTLTRYLTVVEDHAGRHRGAGRRDRRRSRSWTPNGVPIEQAASA